MAHPHQLNCLILSQNFQENQRKMQRPHFLRTDDWMEAHNSTANQKVRRFCLTLAGEARLWYETLGAAQLDWETLQDHF